MVTGEILERHENAWCEHLIRQMTQIVYEGVLPPLALFSMRYWVTCRVKSMWELHCCSSAFSGLLVLRAAKAESRKKAARSAVDALSSLWFWSWTRRGGEKIRSVSMTRKTKKGDNKVCGEAGSWILEAGYSTWWDGFLLRSLAKEIYINLWMVENPKLLKKKKKTFLC